MSKSVSKTRFKQSVKSPGLHVAGLIEKDCDIKVCRPFILTLVCNLSDLCTSQGVTFPNLAATHYVPRPKQYLHRLPDTLAGRTSAGHFCAGDLEPKLLQKMGCKSQHWIVILGVQIEPYQTLL
jgi:hypothetical protein